MIIHRLDKDIWGRLDLELVLKWISSYSISLSLSAPSRPPMILLLLDEVAKLAEESVKGFGLMLTQVGESLDANCSRMELFKLEAVFSSLNLQLFKDAKSSSGRPYEVIEPLTPIKLADLKETIAEIIIKKEKKMNQVELNNVVFILNLLFFTAWLMALSVSDREALSDDQWSSTYYTNSKEICRKRCRS
jgi:hypothetical protein